MEENMEEKRILMKITTALGDYLFTIERENTLAGKESNTQALRRFCGRFQVDQYVILPREKCKIMVVPQPDGQQIGLEYGLLADHYAEMLVPITSLAAIGLTDEYPNIFTLEVFDKAIERAEEKLKIIKGGIEIATPGQADVAARLINAEDRFRGKKE